MYYRYVIVSKEQMNRLDWGIALSSEYYRNHRVVEPPYAVGFYAICE
jgi:hypothetical protein